MILKKALRLGTSDRGFSLMEMVVTIAVISVLAAIAVPNVKRAIRKAKQNEAKTQLSSLHSAMRGYFGEFSVHNPRFDANGYKPDGFLQYRVGFAADTSQTLPTLPQAAGTPTCVNTWATTAECRASFKIWTEDPSQIPHIPTKPSFPFQPFTSRSVYTAYAVGWIGGAVLDTWSMTESRALANPSSGLE